MKHPSDRPVLCRNCCTPMTKGATEWLCERCGLQWTGWTEEEEGKTSTTPFWFDRHARG